MSDIFFVLWAWEQQGLFLTALLSSVFVGLPFLVNLIALSWMLVKEFRASKPFGEWFEGARCVPCDAMCCVWRSRAAVAS